MPNYWGSDLFEVPTVPSTAKKALSIIIWSKQLHEVVRKKIFWNKFIGKEITSEGDLERIVSGAPIVEYSQFEAQRGSTLVLPIEFPLTSNPRETGVVGAEILTGTERGLKYGHTTLYIEQWRYGVRVENEKMQQQRTNIPLVERAVRQLGNIASSHIDNEYTHTLIWGSSANLQRSYDITGGLLSTSPVAPKAHPNNFYWIGSTSPSLVNGTPSGWDASANVYPTPPNLNAQNFFSVSLDLFDEIYAWLNAKGIPPYSVSNELTSYIVVMHPYTAALLRANPKWQQYMQFAMPRGTDNPLFTASLGMWNNFLFYVTDKVPLYYPLNLNQQTVSYATEATFHPIFNETGDYIKLTLTKLTSYSGNYYEYTSSGWSQAFAGADYGTKWVIAPIFILGANAMGSAFARYGARGYQSYFPIIPSERSDYGNFVAYATQAVYGMKRLDWIDNNTIFNQSGAIIWVGQRIYAGLITDEFNII